MRIQYPATVSRDEDGRYLVKFRDFGWGGTDGESIEEALSEASDCLDELIAVTMENDEALPVPGDMLAINTYPVVPSALLAAKAAIYGEQKAKRHKKTELAEMVGKDEKFIRTLLDPNAGSKIQSIEEVLHALGKRLVISVEDDLSIQSR
ncbi:type II toxin-antitoxin system HicB family antitoxin [Endozoicomonas euniceicola]|uniref:Type II toxin-antitoxin system HicB family antitoxin n=1 Tax=Endozoicomonas euniceicola TaxID=1234143 RepID=A0ABY6H0S4_9GAMM|nr:type II toxin-antitoxin system HicB family antitoxin [Endozoicomonas euniceicola]UYM18659.1 type II toxin-antitoxin system HicB family antitoxin [Endozoicomonas euniceicola]